MTLKCLSLLLEHRPSDLEVRRLPLILVSVMTLPVAGHWHVFYDAPCRWVRLWSTFPICGYGFISGFTRGVEYGDNTRISEQ